MKNVKYFNNSKIRPIRQRKISVKFNLEEDALAGGRTAIQQTWTELQNDLISKKYNYTDADSVKKSNFLGVLNQLLEYEEVQKKVTIDLKYFAKSKIFLRAARIRSEEIVNKQRFIPNADKMTMSNRFSPIGVEWLYLAFDKYLVNAKSCCLAEIRANENDNVKYCKFLYNAVDKKVIDLTISDKKSWEEICEKTSNEAESSTIQFLLETYCKLLSEELFVPVNSNEKEYKYIPFHCMAQFFINKGYSGIIYKSTVSSFGKNLVMFDKSSFIPTEIL